MCGDRESKALSIRDLFRALRRSVLLVVGCLLIGLAAGGGLALTQPASYTTQVRLFVSSNASDSTDSLLQNSNLVLQRVPSYVTLVNSPLVIGEVVQRLGLTEPPDAVAQRITASNPLQTALIEITVRDDTARGAYDLAGALAQAVATAVQRVETSSTGFTPVKVTVVSPPALPAGRDLAGPVWRLGVGLLLGLLVGAAVAVARELTDSRLKDPEQLRTVLGLPPLATITVGTRPDRAPPPTEDAYWATPAGEGYRQLRTNLQVLADAAGLRSVLVIGPHRADDAHQVARNLAVAHSLAGVRVLLVEADLRHPAIAETFGLDAGPGLATVLAGESDVDAVIHRWRDSTLHVLPAGSSTAGSGEPLAGSGELLASDAMNVLLGRLERRFDLVIVAAPPLLDAADAAILATRVDGVVLTTRHRGTRLDAVWRSVQALHDVRARVLGAVVLHRSGRLDGSRPFAAADPTSWPGGRPDHRTASPITTPGEQGTGEQGQSPKRPLRPVPDLPAPLALPSAAEARPQTDKPRGVAALPQARGVAAVGGGNRVEPPEAAADDEEAEA